MSRYDIAVIGGGPAGLAAATNTRMRGLDTVLYEAEIFGGQLVNLYPTKPVSNFPAQPELASRELAERLADQASRFGAELHELEAVESVERHAQRFVLRTARREDEAGALVLALGLGRFRPRPLGLEDEQRYLGRGLTYRLPPLDEVRAQRILVIGGGDTAVDAALSLRQVAPVTLLHRSGKLRAFGHSQEQLGASGVELLLGGRLERLEGDEQVEQAIVVVDDERLELPVDLVLVSVGQVPDMSGIAHWQLPLRESRLTVSPAMETELAGVFAAGDIASYAGKVKMIATAVGEGSTAAASAERFLDGGGLSAS